MAERFLIVLGLSIYRKPATKQMMVKVMFCLLLLHHQLAPYMIRMKISRSLSDNRMS